MTLLKFLRIERGLSKFEAIRLVVLPSDQYALLEAGIVPQHVHAKAARKLEAAFGYPFDRLLSDAGAIIDRALQRDGVEIRPQARVVDCGSSTIQTVEPSLAVQAREVALCDSAA